MTIFSALCLFAFTSFAAIALAAPIRIETRGIHTTTPHRPIRRAGVFLRSFKGSELVPSAGEAVIYFYQYRENSPVIVKGEIIGTGLAPNSQHGWHIHEFGDLFNGCASVGPHYNPEGQHHGAPWDHQKHAGDLGNLNIDMYGDLYIEPKVINDRVSLNGPNSIIGRALVIHLGADDLGKGGKPDSLTSGASGERLACGIIGVLPDYD
ncbi:hypothetical protein FA15DRAFT_754208 [Coprinopsis marcescibilis]|uniref:Superoxide dismutase copper/zinc binding domain-containing protein n=1 Tax=Coprinopsis marcescibilis TaxID=230819 RepID=A0A5C3L445_COPMA|nr:hypothetical protein FA15DRAFT_754208 [Coprinopsis marcescibilis]